jgi:hypothetical protein
LGDGNGRKSRKFYELQVERIISLLERKYKEKITLEQYLSICEQTQQEPDPERMPVDDSMFPFEVQQALFVHSLLPDRWDGMSGSYMGKDWAALQGLLDIYEIEDKKSVAYFLKHIEAQNMASVNKELKRKRDAEARKNK